jgi:hypothetical protein
LLGFVFVNGQPLRLTRGVDCASAIRVEEASKTMVVKANFTALLKNILPSSKFGGKKQITAFEIVSAKT